MMKHWENFFKNITLSCFLSILLLPPNSNFAQAQETGEEIDVIASMVRQHGYSCLSPSGMEQDLSDSTALEEAWIISCENGRFRVKILGDEGAEVTPLL